MICLIAFFTTKLLHTIFNSFNFEGNTSMLGGPPIKHGSNCPLPPHPHQGLALIRQEAHSEAKHSPGPRALQEVP